MGSTFSNPAFWSRLQFAFTITYHYLATGGAAIFPVFISRRYAGKVGVKRDTQGSY